MGGSGGALGELWEALAELREALGELWEGLYIEKTPDQPPQRTLCYNICSEYAVPVKEMQCLCRRNAVPVQQNTMSVQQIQCLCRRNAVPVQQIQCLRSASMAPRRRWEDFGERLSRVLNCKPNKRDQNANIVNNCQQFPA